MVTVNSELCSTDRELRSAKVVLHSNLAGPAAIEELNSADAKNLAVKYAAGLGMGNPRLNGNPRVYGVNSAGKEVGPAEMHAAADKVAAAPVAYRAEIPIIRGII